MTDELGSVAVAVRSAADVPAESDRMISEIRNATGLVPSMTAEEAQKALIWAEAVAASAKMQRAWDIAREACEMKVRTERRLGALITHQMGRGIADIMTNPISEQDAIRLDPKMEGAYASLSKIPDGLFDRVITDLLDRHKSVDVFTVLRASHRESLEFVEAGISVAWDGSYFLSGYTGSVKRASSNDLAKVREELHKYARLSQEKRPSQVVALDEAYAKARRDAQALETLGGRYYGDVSDLISEAELKMAQAAEILFKAYTLATATNGKRKAIR